MTRSVALIGLVAAGSSGVSRYATALARALGEVTHEFPDLQLRLITTRAGIANLGEISLDVRMLPIRGRLAQGGPGRILLEQWCAATSRANLVHFFDLSGPLLAPGKAFSATIHDASVIHGYSVVRQAYKRRLYPWALRRARATVAISSFAREEALRHFAAPAERVRVIRSGPGFAPVGNGAGPARDFGLGGPYFLYVGNLTASKNLPFLVRAFERSEVSATLVLAGRPGERFGELEAALAKTRSPIRVLQDARDEDLDGLYRNATALLLPSRYEGFAFTPLEAMARDCPVLASDIPAIREISGGGAMLLPVDDEAAWGAALRELVGESDTRADLRKRGAAHVARYSWLTTARELCDLFLDVAP